ncbi:MAG: 2-phosphosulfolactate phosphatase [Chloroflexi bacterium]|nr:MAG: 2-phosphosulfolactate phosphatase [Chloroflexota bacterium]
MKFKRVTLENCHEASGLVVVIDVLRAFTTAAFAFGAGAEKILLVSTVDEALVLRNRFSKAFVMGEVFGVKPDSFDFDNSPYTISRTDVNGRVLIQRTSAGTQGVVCSAGAEILLTGSFVCAQATVDFINQVQPEWVTFVITGIREGGYGDEDTALADYLEMLLRKQTVEAKPYLDRVRQSISGLKFAEADRSLSYSHDLACAVNLDRFSFAMQVQNQDNRLVLKPVTSFQ